VTLVADDATEGAVGVAIVAGVTTTVTDSSPAPVALTRPALTTSSSLL